MIIKLLVSWLRGRGATIALSLAFMGLSLYYGVCFELQSRLDSQLQQLTQRGVRLRLSQFNVSGVPQAHNAAPFYSAAIELAGQNDLRMEDTLQKTLATVPDIPSRLDERNAVYSLLTDGYQRPDCVYRFDMSQGFNMKTPNFLGMRTLFQRVGLKALIDIRAGNVQDAVELETHAICFLRRFNSGGTLIEAMIKVACGKIALEPLEAMADQGLRADYSNLLREIDLELTEARPALARAVEVERAGALELFGDKLDSVLAQYTTDEMTYRTRLYRLGGRPLQLLDELNLLAIYDRYDRALQNHTPEQLTLSPTEIPQAYLVSVMMIPNIGRAHDVHEKYLTRLQQVRDRLATLNSH